MRGVTSFVLALAVTGLLLAGPCLACAKLVKQSPHSGCCTPVRHCQDPGPRPVQAACASPAVDLSTAKQATPVPVAAPLLVAHHAPVVVLRNTFPLAPDVGPYSPPDLYLLHSVLTI